MGRIPRNAPCPCGSGRKYKLCCLPEEPAPGGPDRRTRPLETIDATARGCLWTIYERQENDAARPSGEIVEHHCSGDRFTVDGAEGWLRNGEPISMLAALDALPPQLADWVLPISRE